MSVAVHHHLKSGSVERSINDETVVYISGMTCVPMVRTQFLSYCRYIFGRTYPDSILYVDGYWTTGEKGYFNVSLATQRLPLLDYIHNCPQAEFEQYRKNPIKLCIELLDWTKPYRFTLIRNNQKRMCFLCPIILNSHWSLLAEFENSPFLKLLDAVMMDSNWPRKEVYFCL